MLQWKDTVIKESNNEAEVEILDSKHGFTSWCEVDVNLNVHADTPHVHGTTPPSSLAAVTGANFSRKLLTFVQVTPYEVVTTNQWKNLVTVWKITMNVKVNTTKTDVICTKQIISEQLLNYFINLLQPL